ncbi:MFS transporter [Rhodoferax sp. GW822-FHT02A01]|uniref:MFS transporter n=1 Tax=Rhodoferax sp. GW822-FHT02A01 TaxID=3141537 RepID=UPI00315C4F4E
MKHYRQWSAAFASYFTILGLWTAFGPGALMEADPKAAPLALAVITLVYFVATPFVKALWNWLGFARTIVLMGAGVSLSLCTASVAPQWLAWCVPVAFFFGSASYTLCETKMLEDLAHAGQGHAFGRARKWGSFGFLAAASLGGAAFSVGGVGRSFSIALGLCSAVYFFCCVALARASRDSAPDHTLEAPHTAPAAAAPTAPAREPDPKGYGTATLRRRVIGSAAVSVMRLAEAVATTWFGAYWLATGHSPLQTGLLCALPVAAEFLAMWKGGALLARYSAPAMMLFCCGISALRWLATPMCSALWCAVPLQSVHAFTFGFFYPASLIWLKQAFGDSFFQIRYATESGARALTAAVSYAAASWLLAALGYGAIFAISSALAALTGLWWWRVLRG